MPRLRCLQDLFRDAGRISELRLPRDLPHSRGVAHIEFDTAAAANRATQRNGLYLGGRSLRVLLDATNHSERPPVEQPKRPRVKTRMCTYFVAGKTCHKGDNCNYAHHPRELPPDRRGGSGDAGGRGAHRSGGIGGPMGGAHPGDWICGQCRNLNYARRTECNKCRAPRPAAPHPTLSPAGYGGGGGSGRGGGGGGSFRPQPILRPAPPQGGYSGGGYGGGGGGGFPAPPMRPPPPSMQQAPYGQPPPRW